MSGVSTSDPTVLWLVIAGSAFTTGLVLALLKLLIDRSCEHSPAPHTTQPAPDRLQLTVWSPGPPRGGVPHTHFAAMCDETTPITPVPASRARHRKEPNS